jgi:hypothetical protein
MGLGYVGENPPEKVVEPLADAAFVDLDLAYFGTGAWARLGSLTRRRHRRFVTSCFH